MSNKVCILAAGRGTRLGKTAKLLNKALHTVNNKAAITWIIQKFPSNTEFVIAIGYLGDQVVNYLSMAHPEVNFQYVRIEDFDGPNSGPGKSLEQCKHLLQCPFFFVSCDTLWTDDMKLSSSENWLGVSAQLSSTYKQYCNVKVENGNITALSDKEALKDPNYRTFIGLCFIKDFEIFWKYLDVNKLIKGEPQISSGLNALIQFSNVKAVTFDWMDIGDKEKYLMAVNRYENFNFSKTGESLYFVNNKVIKFFSDREVASKRVAKAKLSQGTFPTILQENDQFYAYEYLAGQTLYEYSSLTIFERLLEYLKTSLWKDKKIDLGIFFSACRKFYIEKTFQRVDAYKLKYPKEDITLINGNVVQSLEPLLKKIDWEFICDGSPVFFHGDLQFDNILYDRVNKKFTLIDWRQDFGGHFEFGDIYYDLAKLYGGLVLNYDFVKKGLIEYREENEMVVFDFAQRYQYRIYLAYFEKWLHSNNYNVKKVRILVALIYLNMAPLHHYPFDKILSFLGRSMLAELLEEINLRSHDGFE